VCVCVCVCVCIWSAIGVRTCRYDGTASEYTQTGVSTEFVLCIYVQPMQCSGNFLDCEV
jgi:hypothetical protein